MVITQKLSYGRSIIFLVCTASIVNMGCGPQPPKSSPTATRATMTARARLPRANTIEQLHSKYMKGSATDAEAAMIEANSIASADPFSPPSLHLQFVGHSRLHLLAKLRRDEDTASCEFVRAKFWYLMTQQQPNNHTKQELSRLLAQFTEIECDRLIIAWDKGVGNDIGVSRPRYWDELVGKETRCEEWLESVNRVKG